MTPLGLQALSWVLVVFPDVPNVPFRLHKPPKRHPQSPHRQENTSNTYSSHVLGRLLPLPGRVQGAHGARHCPEPLACSFHPQTILRRVLVCSPLYMWEKGGEGLLRGHTAEQRQSRDPWQTARRKALLDLGL